MREGPIVASISGGKDSTALCLHLKEQGIEYRTVHMDTGWEHPDTDSYIRDVLNDAIGPVEWISGPMLMRELIIKKAMFPSRLRRYCTSFLKIYPFMQWLSMNYPHDQVVNATGIRAAESRARAELEEWEDLDWATTWRPLLTWSEQDVIDIHTRHGLAPNPLYLMGARRVGCWPCIFSCKKEIEMVARLTPERIDEIRELERMLTEKANAPRAFFHPHDKREIPTIDDVVAWSRTAHGGKQYEMFTEDDRAGCMRWGLCES